MGKRTIVVTGKPDHFNRASHGAQARYRYLTPIRELERYVPNLMVREHDSGSVPVMDGADIILLHVPTSLESREAVQNAHFSGRKIWVDLDDYVFGGKGISPANAAWGFFNHEQNKESLDIALAFADIITVSTEHLKKLVLDYFAEIRDLKDKVVVIPNAIPDFLWAKRKPFQKDEELTKILWRGSLTHEGDLFLFQESFKPIKDLGYHFFGHLPWFFNKEYKGFLSIDPKINFTPWEKGGFYNYIEKLKILGAHWVVFPLENNDFNKAKSNIAWLEGTLAGMTSIIPKYMPEFANVPGVKFNNDPHHLLRMLQLAAKKEFDREALYKKSCEIIEDKYLLSITNEKRLQIINEI